ncbi:hypothetical protein HK101_010569 [Irineochytrium annulatum]|nr:hypothetical protein HK101_010569 [Irineochytrium annulatum]
MPHLPRLEAGNAPSARTHHAGDGMPSFNLLLGSFLPPNSRADAIGRFSAALDNARSQTGHASPPPPERLAALWDQYRLVIGDVEITGADALPRDLVLRYMDLVAESESAPDSLDRLETIARDLGWAEGCGGAATGSGEDWMRAFGRAWGRCGVRTRPLMCVRVAVRSRLLSRTLLNVWAEMETYADMDGGGDEVVGVGAPVMYFVDKIVRVHGPRLNGPDLEACFHAMAPHSACMDAAVLLYGFQRRLRNGRSLVLSHNAYKDLLYVLRQRTMFGRSEVKEATLRERGKLHARDDRRRRDVTNGGVGELAVAVFEDAVALYPRSAPLYDRMLRIAQALNDIELVNLLLVQMVERGLVPSPASIAGLVDLHLRVGRFEEARDIFDTSARLLGPSSPAKRMLWEAWIKGWAKKYKWATVIKALEEMRTVMKPSAKLYSQLIMKMMPFAPHGAREVYKWMLKDGYEPGFRVKAAVEGDGRI